MQRHKILADRLKRKKDSQWSREICDEWIKKLTGFYENGYLDDPNGLYCLHEACFTSAEMWKRVNAVKGNKNVTTAIDGDPKEPLTVFAAGNATGLTLTPLILFGTYHSVDWLDNTDDTCGVAALNSRGWKDCSVLTAYIRKCLLSSMTARKVRPDQLID